MEFRFGVPANVRFGRGCVNQLGTLLKSLKVEKVLLVHGKSVEKSGLSAIVEKLLDAENIGHADFDRIEPDPRDVTFEAGAEKAKAENVDAIVAIGGGSAMDCAKGISILTTNPGPISRYEGFDQVPEKGKILVCIPTTAGTSSELTNVSIVTDTSADRKYIIGGNYIGADYALVDPDLTDNLPVTVTANTGIDAMTHAIESYASLGATPLTKPLSLQAAKIIYDNLETAVKDGSCKEARENMALACVIVGCAFPNAGNGLVHAISHVLGAQYHMAHGAACAVTLPAVIEFNSKYAAADYEVLAETLKPGSGQKLSEMITELERAIGLPKLSDFVQEADLPHIAEEAMKEDAGPNPNQEITYEAVLEILKTSWQA